MRRQLFFLFLLLNLFQLSFAKDNVQYKTLVKKESPEITYKMLYENQLAANNSILNTIFYALGGLGAAILFVFASNWWFNEKKVLDIKKGINNQIESEINKIQIDLQKEVSNGINSVSQMLNEFIEKHRIEIKEDNKLLSENYQIQLKNFIDNINIQIATLKTSYDERLEVLQKEIDLSNDEIKKSIANAKKSSDVESKKIRMKLCNTEASLWTVKGVFLNAVRYYVEEGKLSLEVGYVWNLKYVLEKLEENVSKCTYIYESDLREFNEFSNSIPAEEFESEKARVVELINKLKVEKG